MRNKCDVSNSAANMYTRARTQLNQNKWWPWEYACTFLCTKI